METEVIEIFNELAIKLNISKPHTNVTCFYHNRHHHEESNVTKKQHEEEYREELNKEHDIETSPFFCASLYSLARKMLLSLNYTTLSCLENGTVERSAITTNAPPSHTNPSLGESSIVYMHVDCRKSVCWRNLCHCTSQITLLNVVYIQVCIGGRGVAGQSRYLAPLLPPYIILP